jgi:hypothetical protein
MFAFGLHMPLIERRFVYCMVKFCKLGKPVGSDYWQLLDKNNGPVYCVLSCSGIQKLHITHIVYLCVSYVCQNKPVLPTSTNYAVNGDKCVYLWGNIRNFKYYLGEFHTSNG